jgi:hypothetical protein
MSKPVIIYAENELPQRMIMMRSLGNDFVVKEFPDGEPALEAIRQ